MHTLQIGRDRYLFSWEQGAADLTPAAVEALVRQALDGAAAWDAMVLEQFSDGEGALVFVRLLRGQPRYFAFADSERLLAACAGCPPETVSSLYADQGRYVLALYPEPGGPPLSLYEFGRELAVSPHYPAHLAEYGKALLTGQAVRELRRLFP